MCTTTGKVCAEGEEAGYDMSGMLYDPIFQKITSCTFILALLASSALILLVPCFFHSFCPSFAFYSLSAAFFSLSLTLFLANSPSTSVLSCICILLDPPLDFTEALRSSNRNLKAHARCRASPRGLKSIIFYMSLPGPNSFC